MKTPKTKKERNDVYKLLSETLNINNRWMCNNLKALNYTSDLRDYKELWFIIKKDYDGRVLLWEDFSDLTFNKYRHETVKRKQILLDLAQII